MNNILKKKINILIISMFIMFLVSSITFAAETPVNVIKPEVKDVENVRVVNSKIEPYQDVNVSSKTGGIIERVNIVIGQYVKKGQPLIEFEQDNIKIQIQQAESALQIAKTNYEKMLNGATEEQIRTAEAGVKQAEAALLIAKTNYEKLIKGATDEQIRTAEAGVKQAEAALKIAKSNFRMLKDGATKEDRESAQARYQQAVSSYEGAKSNLELLQSSYNDRIMQKQQLVGSETQLKSAEKQVEVAEERLQQATIGYKQAQNSLEQAKNEYDRIKYLYQEDVATKKQYEMVENQYQNAKSAVENAKSAVESARIAKEQADVSYKGAKENYTLSEDSYNNPIQLEQQVAAAKTQLEVAEANKRMARASLEKIEKGARSEELATAQANVEQAEAALDRAKAQLDQVKKGATEEDKIISKANINQAEAALDRAKAQLDQVKNGVTEEDKKISQANIKQAEAALKQAQKALSDTIIKSPIAGIVAQSNFDAGEMAGPGTPLVNIVNLDKVYIKAEVTADILVNINEGDQIRARILAYQNKFVTGKIDYIGSVADPRTQAFTVKVLVENPDLVIKGGMFADLYLTTKNTRNALVIPTAAVLELENSPYVYVVNNGKARRQPVEIGIVKDNEVVIENGLTENDQVIIRGQNSISDGVTIKVVG